jgi:glycosyltransferase involved in cell wall biosynthesis
MTWLSVVVPVYGNADALPELHRRLSAVLDRMAAACEVIYVDDASSDASPVVLRDVASRDGRVRVVTLPRNVGQQRALLSGIERASGEWVVTMDADLQDPPEAIPALLAAGSQGAEVVFAGRRGRYESSVRLLTSRVYKRLLSWLSGVPVDAGAFVAMRQGVRQSLLELAGPEPVLVPMLAATGARLRSIPVNRESRPGGGSGYSSWARLRIAARGLRWAVRTRLRVEP